MNKIRIKKVWRVLLYISEFSKSLLNLLKALAYFCGTAFNSGCGDELSRPQLLSNLCWDPGRWCPTEPPKLSWWGSPANITDNRSMDWFKGKSTGNHGFYHQTWGFHLLLGFAHLWNQCLCQHWMRIPDPLPTRGWQQLTPSGVHESQQLCQWCEWQNI